MSPEKLPSYKEPKQKKILPGAEPFLIKKGKIGCLLSHGFTGSPREMRPLGDFLVKQGISVIGPRLPGHGTEITDLQDKTFADWYQAYSKAYQKIASFCEEVFIADLSLGGALTLKFASEHKVSGIICYSAIIQMRFLEKTLLTLFTPFLKKQTIQKSRIELQEQEGLGAIAYSHYPIAATNSLRQALPTIRRNLKKITEPILLIYGTKDARWIQKAGKIIFDNVSSEIKELLYFPNSPHCLTLGSEKEAIWEKTWQFIQQYCV
jgi:carboxylesterase